MAWTGEERRRESSQERIAILETQVESLKGELKLIQNQLDAVLGEMTRYRGFLGGVTFIVSGALVAWQFCGDWVKKNL